MWFSREGIRAWNGANDQCRKVRPQSIACKKERYALNPSHVKRKLRISSELFRLKLTECWRGPGGSMNSNLFESLQIQALPSSQIRNRFFCRGVPPSHDRGRERPLASAVITYLRVFIELQPQRIPHFSSLLGLSRPQVP